MDFATFCFSLLLLLFHRYRRCCCRCCLCFIMAQQLSQGTSKVLQKLAKSVEDGDYYGALQMYKTLARR
jgi:hypothetical protein